MALIRNAQPVQQDNCLYHPCGAKYFHRQQGHLRCVQTTHSKLQSKKHGPCTKGIWVPICSSMANCLQGLKTAHHKIHTTTWHALSKVVSSCLRRIRKDQNWKSELSDTQLLSWWSSCLVIQACGHQGTLLLESEAAESSLVLLHNTTNQAKPNKVLQYYTSLGPGSSKFANTEGCALGWSCSISGSLFSNWRPVRLIWNRSL